VRNKRTMEPIICMIVIRLEICGNNSQKVTNTQFNNTIFYVIQCYKSMIYTMIKRFFEWKYRERHRKSCGANCRTWSHVYIFFWKGGINIDIVVIIAAIIGPSDQS